MPGVYMQGLLIYNADGTIMHEENLAEHLCHEVIALAKELGKGIQLPSVKRCDTCLPML